MTTRILFVCTGNRARSQMAEGLARALVAPGIEVASAGTRPQGIHPLAIQAMQERGIDITAQRSKRLDEVAGEFDYVITLCDDAARDCPALPARRGRIQWSLPDPGRAGGDEAQLAIIFRQVREEIERRLRQWLGEEGLLAEKS